MHSVLSTKKGVSALIVVVLLLVFTVAIGTLISAWVYEYFKDTTDSATNIASGPKGITYCANSIVEISNVDLKNTAVASNISVTSGTVNYFNLTSIAGTPTITFTGRSSSSGINGLAGWWHFDEAGGASCTDSSGTGNTGTMQGGMSTTVDGDLSSGRVSSGMFNNALKFDGSDDYVDCGNDSSLNITDAITIEAWIKGTGGNFSSTTRTTSAYDKYSPQFQVVGDKIYYVWQGRDTSTDQIWTAEMNTDGTGWNATKRTTGIYQKKDPQLQVVGSKIYYIFSVRELIGDYRDQIWTAEMNTDGTGWNATNRTSSLYDKHNYQLRVVGDKIYYAWREPDDSGNRQVWTAEMNTDGTGWNTTNRTSSPYNKYAPQLQVVDSKIYYAWYEPDDSGNRQVWTAEMNTDGTGWNTTNRTSSPYNKYSPHLQVVGSKIYYGWEEEYTEIWTAEMNTDGTGWNATKRQEDANWEHYSPCLQVVGNKIYYAWQGWNNVTNADELWTAEMNTDGTGWNAIQRTTGDNSYTSIQFQVVGTKIYYVYGDYAGANMQIITAEINSNIVYKGDLYGLGISNNTIKGFINAGVDGFKYKAEAINQTAGATAQATIDSDWNHVTMTYNKSTLALYVNGTLQDTASFAELINTNPFKLIIGDDFNGSIDEVRIYNRALTADEISETYNTATLGGGTTTDPKASINDNVNVSYTGTLSTGESAIITVDAGNFTVGENNITIYTDAGVVDYSVKMLELSALVSNTGMNNVTVKQVVAFRDDGTYCILKNESYTFDVGDMFAVSGCGMECSEFLALKAYTDCTGVQGIFSGVPESC